MSELRWVNKRKTRMAVPEIDAFLAEVIEVCRKHNMSISHEDGHGAFEVETFSDGLVEWLSAAGDNR